MTGLSRTAVGPRATVALSGHPVTTALPDFELRGGWGESAFEDQSLLENHRFESKDDTETLSARESNESRCLPALCISAFLIRPHALKIGDGTFLSSFSCSLVVEEPTKLGSVHFEYTMLLVRFKSHCGDKTAFAHPLLPLFTALAAMCPCKCCEEGRTE